MKMRKELNNKGFSLVELMIATVILAIIVAPLLHTFVTAAATTARSRRLGDATLVGENIAETVEVTPLSELADADYFEEATSKQFYSLDAGGYTPLDPSATAAAPYHFGVTGLREGSSTFDAMITLDPSVYRTGNAANKGLNDIKVSDYSNMDGVYVQTLDSDNPDEIAWDSFVSKANQRYSQWYPDTAKPVRTITLEIKTEGPENNLKIKALLHFDYEYTFRHDELDPVTGAVIDSPFTKLKSDRVTYDLMPQGPFHVASNNNRWPNIYVIYYPFYGDGTDIIKIQNKYNDKARPFNLFLVKGSLEEVKPEVLERFDRYDDYKNKDPHYNAKVEQYVPTGASEGDCAVIYSNIKENLYTESRTQLSTVDYRIYRGQYFSRKGFFAGEAGDLVSKTARDRIFNVTVDIYEADGNFATLIHTVKSTKLQ